MKNKLQILLDSGILKADIARHCGVSWQTVHWWSCGKIAKAKPANEKKLDELIDKVNLENPN
jgi:hypothetical protein